MSENGRLRSQIAEIERELRVVAAEAAKAGNWSVVKAASMAAECLKPVCDGLSASAPATVVAERSPRRVRARTSVGVHGTGSGYPRFATKNGELVKIGWSRREKAEYRHRASNSSVQLVARAIVELSRDGRLFNTDDLFPVIDPEDGTDVPSYQSYLILRWFRNIGVVEQQGRSEYQVSDPEGLVGNVNEAWKILPPDQDDHDRNSEQRGGAQ